MHLITVTRPYEGRWDTRVWVLDQLGPIDLNSGQLPEYIGRPGQFACAHPRCAYFQQVKDLREWQEGPPLNADPVR